jgi:hypothetical protein
MKSWRIRLREPDSEYLSTARLFAIRVMLSALSGEFNAEFLHRRLRGQRFSALTLREQRRLVRSCLLEQLRDEMAGSENVVRLETAEIEGNAQLKSASLY